MPKKKKEEPTNNCPICGCPVKDVLIATILAFLVIFLFEWGFHGVYMMPDYEATKELWRSPEAMQELFHFSVIGQLIRALAVGGLFCWASKSCAIRCPSKGTKFGLLIGLLSAGMSVGSYAWMPVPLEIPLKWAAGEIVMGVVIGVVLAVAFRKMKKDAA